MYADRYSSRHGLNPGGVAFALGASGVLLFGLSLTAPHFVEKFERPLIGHNIPLDPPPPPKPEPRPQPKTVQQVVVAPPRERIDVTPPPTKIVTGGIIATRIDTPPVKALVAGAGAGAEIGTATAPPHMPLIGKPQLDARYIDAFQPNYPSDERLAGREGRVVVRVLIGTDGRVKQVEQISAASPAFFEATRKRALEKWRFKPGTRDGVAVEAWETMSVRFVMNEE